MDYIVNGGKKLCGSLDVYGAKNCALTLLAATILTDEEVVLTNCPQIVDVDNMLLLLSAVGKRVRRVGNVVSVRGAPTTAEVPRDIACLLRGSALLLAPCLARCGAVTLPLPGGCAIGARPMDIHVDGLRAMGVDVVDNGDSLRCVGKSHGTNYSLRFASVGATENLICAAASGVGEFVLSNCALEPEIVALTQMLVQMGAHIDGVGRSTLHIVGCGKLHGTEFHVIPDRIVAATYLSSVIASGGELILRNCVPSHFAAFAQSVCDNFTFRHTQTEAYIRVKRQPRGYGHIVTAPYPAFHTDMQSQVLSLAALSRGRTYVTERLFENRLRHNCQMLQRMGAEISLLGDTARVDGRRLYGAEVTSADLRGGAALVVAALGAEGTTVVHDEGHISRGYVGFADALCSVGADIHTS